MLVRCGHLSNPFPWWRPASRAGSREETLEPTAKAQRVPIAAASREYFTANADARKFLCSNGRGIRYAGARRAAGGRTLTPLARQGGRA